MVRKSTLLIGEMLVANGLITQEDLEVALNEKKKSGGFLGAILIRLGLVSETDLLPLLSGQLGIEYVRIKELKVDPKVIRKVPARFACHYKLMPVRMEKGILTIAMTDPLDVHTIDDLKLLLRCEVNPVLGGEKDILDGINRYYGIGAETIERIIDETKRTEKLNVEKVAVDDIRELAEDASIIKFVNQILLEAWRDRATDIHIEPYEDELRVRYRIDGVLYDATIPPTIKDFESAIVSRIKIMSSLDIAERRLPQDGRIKIKVRDEEVDLRVSILPTPHGESVDIRLLSTRMLYSLEELGLSKNDLRTLESMIRVPHGIIFVTGPTGSGKTTTLYACLNKINDKDRKIITIEDPIEYMLKGITQIQTHPKIDLTFARGLRSMLRHDPDIMMVGEVRDLETAEITIRVALTGHLVFSTLHTNDAAGGVTRLLDIGIEPYLIASSVICFIAQRLVRLICPQCKREAKPTKQFLEEIKPLVDPSTVKIFEGAGCEACKYTGYKGRTGIYEILVVNDEIRELILRRASTSEIKEKAVAGKMNTLRQDGWDKVLKGRTTISEVMRVTQLEEAG